MVKSISLPLILFSVVAFAQETKLRKVKRERYYEEFGVLANNKKMKHGQYMLFVNGLFETPHIKIRGNYSLGKKNGIWVYYFDRPINQTKEAGFYKDDLKDSLWITYYPENKYSYWLQNDSSQSLEIQNSNTLIRSTEFYRNGNPIGLWKFYSEDQTLVQEYNFDSDSLVYDLTINEQYIGKNHNLMFIGGDYRLKQLLHDNFDFYGLMRGSGNIISLKSGTLHIEVTIDSTGSCSKLKEIKNTIKNEKIIKRAYYSVEKLNGFWIPKYESNVPMAATKLIKFNIDQKVDHRWKRGILDDSNKKITVEYTIEVP